MADRFVHPDGVKARDIRLRGGKLTAEPTLGASVGTGRSDDTKYIDPAKRMGEKGAGESGVQAGSYSKSRRKKYEEMLEETTK